jgi:signal transduction histidine kinase/ActR/RegA family two-component response regulator
MEQKTVPTDDEQFFAPEIWTEALTKFAEATGLTISLYDKSIHRRCDVTTTSPISKRLARANFWNDQGNGAIIDLNAAREAAASGKLHYSVQLEMFAHLAIPIILDGQLRAVFVIGWLPEKFADPVLCDLLSKKIGAPPMEVWQLMRMQQPISREKIEMHALMLETFAQPLIRQLMVQHADRTRALRAKIVNETVRAFAEATTEEQLCEAVLSSVRDYVTSTSIVIEIVKAKGEMEEKTHYSFINKESDDDLGTSNYCSNLKLSIPTTQGHNLGKIEIKLTEDRISEDIVTDLQSIAAQFGTALQKVHLIHALEGERSALKGANIQLQHLHKMKDEFLATVSHELRTPLNAILGWAQILIDEGPNSVEFGPAMETIERNAKNQSNLIEDLLDVSRIISGKMTLQRADIEATDILRQSIATVFPMTEARKQKMHLQISNTFLPLKGDATRVTQIFWNLLSNASKFTPEGGDISVVLEGAGHYFKFEVSDSGKGISREFLPHLFNRFSQADGSYTRRHSGLGLGLAIVRHLVELHGGTVSAQSQGEGKGSTFTVFLPQNTTDKELDHAQVLTQYSNQDTQLKAVKILLVDDEPDSLRLTRFVLEKNGAAVEMADTAADAYQIFKDWRPDILISDISMPGESGYDLIRRVRFLSHEEGGNIPAIALTALAEKSQKRLALSAGFQLHLSKPLEPNLLTSSVMSLLK